MISRTTHVTLEEFERLIDSGEFEKRRERVDLIRGELRVMSPAGPDHEDIVTYLAEWSSRWAPGCGCLPRSEKSVQFDELESLPEPDIVWVRRRRYRRRRPTTADVTLIIEVADSSLRIDRGERADLYAEAGVPEYWIANCIENCMEVFRQPSGGVYQERFIVRPGESIHPLVAPEAVLDVADLFAEE